MLLPRAHASVVGASHWLPLHVPPVPPHADADSQRHAARAEHASTHTPAPSPPHPTSPIGPNPPPASPPLSGHAVTHVVAPCAAPPICQLPPAPTHADEAPRRHHSVATPRAAAACTHLCCRTVLPVALRRARRLALAALPRATDPSACRRRLTTPGTHTKAQGRGPGVPARHRTSHNAARSQ